MTFLSALLPVVFLVGLGHLLARRGLPGPDGWRAMERLCFTVLFPAMIILVLSRAPFEQAPWKIAVPLMAAQVILASTGLLALLWPGISRPAVGSIIQSNSRWNTFVALSLTGVLFQEEGIALTSLAAAVMIPMANILSVTALTHFADSEPHQKRNPVLELLRNPLVIACIIGGTLNALNLPPTGLIETTLELLSQPAITLGLLAAGAGLNLDALKRAGILTVVWSLVRLLGMPVVAVMIAHYGFDLTGVPLVVVAIAAATPTATNGYILARQLGGDYHLMANLIALETVLAIFTMPAILFVFGLLPS